MIEITKQRQALKALQDLLIRARTLTFEESLTFKEVASLLDHLEYLPGLRLEERDTTRHFEEYIEQICDQYNCSDIMDRYKKINP